MTAKGPSWPTGHCPPGHEPYLSVALATSAAYLHTLAHPACLDIVVFEHDDHWHIGHTTKAAGDDCKARDDRRSTRDRVQLNKAHRDGRSRRG